MTKDTAQQYAVLFICLMMCWTNVIGYMDYNFQLSIITAKKSRDE
jgi:hypothetical protein